MCKSFCSRQSQLLVLRWDTGLFASADRLVPINENDRSKGRKKLQLSFSVTLQTKPLGKCMGGGSYALQSQTGSHLRKAKPRGDFGWLLSSVPPIWIQKAWGHICLWKEWAFPLRIVCIPRKYFLSAIALCSVLECALIRFWPIF